jgi:hypothetical protein
MNSLLDSGKGALADGLAQLESPYDLFFILKLFLLGTRHLSIIALS